MFYNASFDEANYYQGNKFQLGGNDRAQSLDKALSFKTKKMVEGRGDDKIYEDAWRTLIRNHKINLAGIDLSVTNGALKIWGKVNQLSEKQEAEKSLELVPGITDFTNELIVTRLEK